MKLVAFILLLSAVLACPNNCNDCDPTATVCFACAEGFELSVLGTCVDSNTVAKCDLYGPTNQCFSCQSTFTINNGQCLKDASACLSYDPSDDSKCITCGFGTILKNNACTGAINCNVSSAAGVCSSCNSGFTLKNGVCSDNTGNCASVGSNGVCSTCKTGFALVGYTCLPSNITVYACYVFDITGNCTLCKAGYNLYQGNCLLPSQIQQIQQGIVQLSSVLAHRSTVAVVTTTTTTTTTLAASGNGFNNNNGFDSGFGSGFDSGFGSGFGDFGSNGGFGSFGGGSTQTVTIANCQSYDPNIPTNCLTCAAGYYTTGPSCAQVSIFCAGYNLLTGACLSCSYGFPLQNGQCNDPNCLTQTAAGCSSCRANYALNSNKYCQLKDPNCAQSAANLCLQCINGYFVSTNGVCVALPSNCLSATPASLCTNCIQGYQPNSIGVCVANLNTVTTTTTTTTTITIANCASQVGLVCNQCQAGYQLNNNQCLQVVSPSTPNCQSYNVITGQCLACVNGYTLVNNTCTPTGSGGSGSGSSSGGAIIIIPGGSNRDPNCAKYNGTTCAQCSNRYYYGPNGLCVPVNPLCNTYSFNGACLSCYPGYTLSVTICIVSKQNDPYCKSWSQAGVCVQCYAGYYYNQAQGACQALNPLCKTSNLTDGTCLSCYPGYNLNAGICAVSFQDPNCQKWDSSKQVCTACSAKFYLDASGKCRQANPLCKTFDSASGACLSCYPGYVISGVNCIVGGSSNSDVNCQSWNNNICQSCYKGYFLNSRGVCTQNNPLCKTSDQNNGNCLSCYPGYVVINGNCTVSTSSTGSSDTNCKSTDSNGICTACYSGYFLTQGMSCQKMDPLCKTYTQSLNACATCYDGYSLLNGQCLISTQTPSANNDPYCIKTNGAACVSCASGYYLPATGVCAQLNPYCKDSDLTNGNCLSCYAGYALSGNTCVVAAVVNIPYCAQVVGNTCASCINGYYVSAGACALVNVLCGTYDQSTGACLSCIPGYVFQAGQCILPSLGIDPNCAQYTNSYCTQCAYGYGLVNYWCNPIDPLCTQYNAATNSCTACAQGKTPQGTSCI